MVYFSCRVFTLAICTSTCARGKKAGIEHGTDGRSSGALVLLPVWTRPGLTFFSFCGADGLGFGDM